MLGTWGGAGDLEGVTLGPLGRGCLPLVRGSHPQRGATAFRLQRQQCGSLRDGGGLGQGDTHWEGDGRHWEGDGRRWRCGLRGGHVREVHGRGWMVASTWHRSMEHGFLVRNYGRGRPVGQRLRERPWQPGQQPGQQPVFPSSAPTRSPTRSPAQVAVDGDFSWRRTAGIPGGSGLGRQKARGRQPRATRGPWQTQPSCPRGAETVGSLPVREVLMALFSAVSFWERQH